MSAARRQWPVTKYTITSLGASSSATGVSPGGLDLTTPSLRLGPGALRDALNFECAQSGGYSRIVGYERLDGHAAPSAAVVTVIQLVSFAFVPAVYATVTQATSGATGIVVAAGASGLLGGGTGFWLAVTAVTGTFDTTHDINAAGPTLVGTATMPTFGLDAKTNAMNAAIAADYYRTFILPVPGSGAILGVVGMIFSGADNVYAFRANAGATAVAIYKATTSGWTLVPFYEIVSFTAGAAAIPADGEVLTQGAVTATVKRVMTQSGAWTGTAVGQFVITTPVGGTTHFAAGAATLSGGATVTLSGVETAITLAIGGRFEFVKCNFSGDIKTRRIYGCDGVNKCFEFDGDVLAPITTGLSPDTPSHITFHKNYLVISEGASILGSAPGLPFVWDSIQGAWEIATGDTVNAMMTLPGDQTTATLGVFLRGNPAMLYGTDPTTFNFVQFNTNAGAYKYTVQNLFDTFTFDDLGVITLRATLNFGNFTPSTLTRNILPFIIQERQKTTATSLCQEKGQYRLFFSDGYGLWLTIVNQQYLGAIPVFFPNPVFCTDDTDLVGGGMASYFGSSDDGGFVYQLEKGTSFDGANINAYIVSAWDPVKSPRILKQFRAASIEVQGDGYAEIFYNYQIAYGNPQTAQALSFTVPLSLNQLAHWDIFTWDKFVWDGTTLLPTDVVETGEGENIQVLISSGSNYIPSYTIDSVIHHYTSRRGMQV